MELLALLAAFVFAGFVLFGAFWLLYRIGNGIGALWERIVGDFEIGPGVAIGAFCVSLFGAIGAYLYVGPKGWDDVAVWAISPVVLTGAYIAFKLRGLGSGRGSSPHEARYVQSEPGQPTRYINISGPNARNVTLTDDGILIGGNGHYQIGEPGKPTRYVSVKDHGGGHIVQGEPGQPTRYINIHGSGPSSR